MQFTTIINIFITVALTLIGIILGGTLSNPLHVFWLSVLILFAVIIQMLNNKVQKQKAELKSERAKVSAFLIRKDNSSQPSVIQCSFYPNNNGAKILKKRRVSVDIYTNSSIMLQSNPELKFTIDKQCNIYINNQSLNCIKYAGKYDFYLKNALVNSWENKYFKYSFEIEFHNIGEHIFKIEASNGQFINEVSNSISVVSG